MHRGASTKGPVSKNAAGREGRRTTARASGVPSAPEATRVSRVAQRTHTASGSWAIGRMKPSSSRLVHTVLTTAQR